MAGVAQKTLFLTFLTLLISIFTSYNTALAQDLSTKQEVLTYKVTLNGLNLGKALISYIPQKNGHYKLSAKTKTEGLAKTFYNIDDTIISYGKINNKELIPSNHTVILNEASYHANKTMLFNYNKNLVKVVNNKNNDKESFVMIDKAKDILSSMYSLRFTSNLEKDKGLKVTETSQYLDKPIKNTINVSKPFIYKLDNGTKINARNVVIESQRIGLNNLSDTALKLIKEGKKSALNYKKDHLTGKEYDKEKNVRIIITDDENKTPLVIEFATKLGTFKAILV